jgi:hypothetical protein
MGFLFGVIVTLGVLHFARNHHRKDRRSGGSRRFSPRSAMRRRFVRRWHRRGMERLADWIDASPAQARVLAEEAEGLLDQAHQVHRGSGGLRGVFAEALRADELDKDAVEGALDARAEAMKGLKEKALAAVERIRGEFDADQRQELAGLVERGPHGCCR